jgi:hypothetical protein
VNVQELGPKNAVRTQDLLIGDALGPVLAPSVDEEFVAAESELCRGGSRIHTSLESEVRAAAHAPETGFWTMSYLPTT